MRPVLTERQRQALDYITDCLNARGYPPTLREIGEHMGIRSTNGVNDHLKALERKGYLVREELKSRALRPLNYGASRDVGLAGSNHASDPVGADPSNHSNHLATHERAANGRLASVATSRSDDQVEIGILGRVAAGEPILAEENIVDRVVIDRYFLGAVKEKDVFGLVVQGDSMIEDGIHDGDYIFVRKQSTAERGEIVVVMIEGEATCKRIFPEGDRVRLQPANASMSPILVDRQSFRSIDILGKVVGVYRRIH